MEELDVHPSELGRILDRPDVPATGISAGDVVGLLGPASAVEVYARAGHRHAIVAAHALMQGRGRSASAGCVMGCGRSWTVW
jgi:hypothetical protein